MRITVGHVIASLMVEVERRRSLRLQRYFGMIGLKIDEPLSIHLCMQQNLHEASHVNTRIAPPRVELGILAAWFGIPQKL